jgi:MarR family transcriptional regulator, organic hydroperoxide resistance regulator
MMLEAMRSVTVSFRGWLAEALPARGISMAQFWTMSDIAEHGPVNAAHLAIYRCVTPPTVSVVVDELVRAGWVERHRSEDDRRIVVLSLTAAGRKLMGELWSHLGKRMGESIREVPQRDLEVAARVLNAFAGRARSEPVVAPGGAA